MAKLGFEDYGGTLDCGIFSLQNAALPANFGCTPYSGIANFSILAVHKVRANSALYISLISKIARSMFIIQRAKNEDAKELTDLTRKSKAYWGYSKEQLEQWHDELRITDEYITNNHVYLIKNVVRIMGYYSFKSVSEYRINLDNIFVDPKYIGTGLGKKLMNDFLKRIKKLGYKIVSLDAEPNAESFYLKFGFKTTGKQESSIPNRFLPTMELKVT